MARLRLREWRERRGLSIRDLAAKAGVAFSTVWQIEAGRLSPTVAMLEKLAKALRVSVRDLLADAPRPRRSTRKEQSMRPEYAYDDDFPDEEDEELDDEDESEADTCEECGEELDEAGECPECDATDDDLDDEGEE